MWDVALADRLGTTPWDVRHNATMLDLIRLNLWYNAKDAGAKVQAQRERAKMSARQISQSTSPRRRR